MEKYWVLSQSREGSFQAPHEEASDGGAQARNADVRWSMAGGPGSLPQFPQDGRAWLRPNPGVWWGFLGRWLREAFITDCGWA